MRILLKSFFALITLIIIGLIALPFVIDPNDYKQEISDAAKSATGRTLTIDGDIGLSVFPWVALELGAVSLSNAEGFTASEFAKVNEVQIRIKLLPLLSKTIELDTVILDGLTLNLEKNKSGKTNWDDLTQQAPAEKTEVKEAKKASKEESNAPALNGFSIAGVNISNSNLHWSDATSGEKYHIENISLTVDPVIAGKATAVMFSTTVKAPSLPDGKADISFKTDVLADLDAQTLSLDNIVLAVQDFLVNGHINVANMMSDKPSIKGQIALKGFNFREFANKLDIELPAMADPTTLTLVKLSTEFSGSATQISTKNLAITLDQTTVSGSFAVTDIATQALKFKLKLDEIDVDRYLPPSAADSDKPASTKPAAKTASTKTAPADDSLPLEALRQINAKGTFDIGKLKVAKLNSTNIHLEIDAHKGLVKLSPLSADLYQGQYKGDVNLDARGKTLKVSLNEHLDKVEVEPLLNDMSGEAQLSGVTMLQVKLTGNGATVEQIKASLNGQGKFSFLNGAIKGINIAESIRQAKAALKGKPLPASNTPIQTDFASLTGSFKMTNGVVNNQDLSMMSPLLRINGAGKINLPKEGLDYKLKVSIVESSKGQAGKDLADLEGLTIPLQITGTFDNPKPSVDMAGLATEEVKAQAVKELDELLGGGDDKEEGASSAKDLLKNFF